MEPISASELHRGASASELHRGASATTTILRLGDCLPYMQALPDHAVNCVITDPPYGIGECRAKVMSRGTSTPKWKRGKSIDYGDFDWDIKLDRVYITEILRVSKHQVISGGNFYADWLPPSSSWIVWDKLNGAANFSDCELFWTSHKKAVRKFAYLWNGFCKQHPEHREHPTQKPLLLMRWIVETYTKPGDTILDPFMGSGTTGVACVQTGRHFIGCECDPRYFEIAQRRIREAEQQPTMD